MPVRRPRGPSPSRVAGPGESPTRDPVPDGQIGSVDLSVLVNTWPGDLYNAFLFLESEDPGTGEQLTKVPTPLGETGVRWRNAAYAVQWWVFAAFALWLWVRMVREEARRGQAGEAPEEVAAARVTMDDVTTPEPTTPAPAPTPDPAPRRRPRRPRPAAAGCASTTSTARARG